MRSPYNPPVSEAWMGDANCATTDPDIFFPEKGDSATPARSICAACEVTAECAAFAERTMPTHGVYAGVTARARHDARRAAA